MLYDIANLLIEFSGRGHKRINLFRNALYINHTLVDLGLPSTEQLYSENFAGLLLL